MLYIALHTINRLFQEWGDILSNISIKYTQANSYNVYSKIKTVFQDFHFFVTIVIKQIARLILHLNDQIQ